MYHVRILNSKMLAFIHFAIKKKQTRRFFLFLKLRSAADVVGFKDVLRLNTRTFTNQYNLWLPKYKMMRQDKIDLVGKRLVFHTFSYRLAKE